MIVEQKINMDQWAKYFLELRSNFEPAIKRGLLSGAVRCIPYLQERTKTALPAKKDSSFFGAFNTGHYHARWRASVLPNGSVVYNTSPYAGVIEGGRRLAPVSKAGRQNIERWAIHKLHLSQSEAKGVAWAISFSMWKRCGLQPRKVMTGDEQLGEMTQMVEEEVVHEIGKELAK